MYNNAAAPADETYWIKQGSELRPLDNLILDSLIRAREKAKEEEKPGALEKFINWLF